MQPIFEYYTPNLSRYPKVSTNKALNQFTEGDLHGNTMRLIESLVHYGVTDIREADYMELLHRYKDALENSHNKKNNLALLALIKKIQIKKPTFLVRLIGDVLADRTGNDLFTLSLIDRLVTSRCNLRILISNHDIHFMTAVMGVSSLDELKVRCQIDSFFSINNQGVSFLRLMRSVERGEVSFSDLQRMAKSYFSTLLLLDYAVNADGKLEIFSHAPINLRRLEELGEQFHVSYPGDYSSNQEKIKFIDAVNTTFRAYVQSGECNVLARLFDELSGTPASKVIWQRESDHTFIDQRFSIVNVYGHDKSLVSAPVEVVRLDNMQGKASLETDDLEYTSFATNSSISPIPDVAQADVQKVLRAYGARIEYHKLQEKKFLLNLSIESLMFIKKEEQDKLVELRQLASAGKLSESEVQKYVKLLSPRIRAINALMSHNRDEFEKEFENYASRAYKISTSLSAPSESVFQPKTQVLSHSQVETLLSKSGFDSGLSSVREKIRQKPNDFVDEAEDLYLKMSHNKENFLKNGRVDEFVRKSKRDLRGSEPKFKQNSVWKQIFLDLLNALIFIASFSLSYWVTGKLRIFSVQIERSNTSGNGIEEASERAARRM